MSDICIPCTMQDTILGDCLPTDLCLPEKRFEEAGKARGAREWETVEEKHVGGGQLGLRRVEGLKRTARVDGTLQRHTPDNAPRPDESRNESVECQTLPSLGKIGKSGSGIR